MASFAPAAPRAPLRLGLPWAELDGETVLLRNWLLVWIVALNAPFMPMWFIGGPSRAIPIVVFAAIGLVVRTWPAWQRMAIFAACLVYSALHFTAGTFNLNMASLVDSVRFLGELNPGTSPEYLAAAVVLACAAIGGLILARRPMDFAGRPQLLGAALAFAALFATDQSFAQDMRGHYERAAPSDARFESAAGRSGWRVASVPGQHKLLIIVESLGLPSGNAELERRLFAFYRTPAVRARYAVSTGATLYYNSTTAGEVRELCGRWGDYDELLERRDPGCLPAKLSRQGYDTIAMHSFTGDMFDRDKWYPNIGFARREFRDQLFAQGAHKCGGVFAGACDRDVPRQIGRTLARASRPTFLYWLTVNSHLPVPEGMNLGVERCAKVSPGLARDYPMICRQLAIWEAIDRELVRAVTAKDFPPTDILIVGDHMPPYFDRTYRAQFDPAHVPWIRLSPRLDGADAGRLATIPAAPAGARRRQG